MMENGTSPTTLTLTGATNVVVYHFPADDPDYPNWVKAGKPQCWGRDYQCKGDADGTFSGKDQDGKRVWVNLSDLNILVPAWGKVDNATWKANPTWICADYDHAFSGKDQDGKRVWVNLSDLNILVAAWGKVDTNPVFSTNPCFP